MLVVEEAGEEERPRSSEICAPDSIGDMGVLLTPTPLRGVGTGVCLFLGDEVGWDVSLEDSAGVGGKGLCRLSLGDLFTCCGPDGFAFVGSMGSFFPTAPLIGGIAGRTFSMLPRDDDSILNLGALEAGMDCVNSSSFAWEVGETIVYSSFFLSPFVRGFAGCGDCCRTSANTLCLSFRFF